MTFNISLSYDNAFTSLMKKLRKKYGDELFDIDGIGKQLDIPEFRKKFFSSNNTADASIDANANVEDSSVISYTNEMPKAFDRLDSYYVLWERLAEKYSKSLANTIIENQLSGGQYIHDFHGFAGAKPYCYNYSTYDLAIKGLSTVKKIKSLPPKTLFSFKSQLEQFITIASNSTLGATGIADVFIVAAYYVDKILKTGVDDHFELLSLNFLKSLTKKQFELLKENISLEELIESFDKKQREIFEENVWVYVKETLISFIYTVNQPQRGNQSAFTNVSIYDDEFLKNIVGDYIFQDGNTPRIETIKKIQELYIDAVTEELKRTPITFPVSTACICTGRKRSVKDKKFIEMISKKDLKNGFLNIYSGDSETLSSCCRLRSKKLKEYFNLFGSGSSKIGSIGVVSINLPRLAILCGDDEKKFKKMLSKQIRYAGYINDIKRDVIQEKIDSNKHPLYNEGFINIDTQYSTVGITGWFECLEILGKDILSDEGLDYAISLIKFINRQVDKNQKIFGCISNIEQTPAENMAIKLASKDKYLGIQDKYSLYSNQFIPTNHPVDIFDRIRIQGEFDQYFSGGSICHLNVDGEIKDYTIVEQLIYEMINAGGIYFARNHNHQECENGHMTVGKTEKCPICNGEIVNNFIRVVGFLTNVKNWHKVRREEDYPNRQFYNEIDIPKKE